MSLSSFQTAFQSGKSGCRREAAKQEKKGSRLAPNFGFMSHKPTLPPKGTFRRRQKILRLYAHFATKNWAVLGYRRQIPNWNASPDHAN
jgi:hypothetical protein